MNFTNVQYGVSVRYVDQGKNLNVRYFPGGKYKLTVYFALRVIKSFLRLVYDLSSLPNGPLEWGNPHLFPYLKFWLYAC